MKEKSNGTSLFTCKTSIVDLGNTLYQWKRSVTGSKEEKLQGVNLNIHFSREKFEGLEQTREYLSHNMMVMIFRCNRMPPKVWWLEGNDRHNTLIEEGVVSRQRSNGRNFSSITNFLQHILIHVPNDSQHGFQSIQHRSMWDTKNSWLLKYNVDPCEEDSNLDIATRHTMYIYVIQTQIWAQTHIYKCGSILGLIQIIHHNLGKEMNS